MAQHTYTVRRKEPSLAYEAVEEGTGHAIALNPQQGPSPAAGSYPDIEAHLASHHGLTLSAPGLSYDPGQGDTLEGQTWTLPARGRDGRRRRSAPNRRGDHRLEV